MQKARRRLEPSIAWTCNAAAGEGFAKADQKTHIINKTGGACSIVTVSASLCLLLAWESLPCPPSFLVAVSKPDLPQTAHTTPLIQLLAHTPKRRACQHSGDVAPRRVVQKATPSPLHTTHTHTHSHACLSRARGAASLVLSVCAARAFGVQGTLLVCAMREGEGLTQSKANTSLSLPRPTPLCSLPSA